MPSDSQFRELSFHAFSFGHNLLRDVESRSISVVDVLSDSQSRRVSDSLRLIAMQSLDVVLKVATW